MGIFKRKKKVLIVEDEADIAEGLKARLSLEKLDIVMADNGQAGVELARQEKPDLVILDVMMPLLNGFDACKILKTDPDTQKIPILILTALSRVEDTEQALAAGADDFLAKPYTNDRLIQKVKKFLP